MLIHSVNIIFSYAYYTGIVMILCQKFRRLVIMVILNKNAITILYASQSLQGYG
jgi:hypothetical protein